MTLILGFTLTLAAWVWLSYRHDIVDTVRAVRDLLTHPLPERVDRHPHMRAMDELGRQ